MKNRLLSLLSLLIVPSMALASEQGLTVSLDEIQKADEMNILVFSVNENIEAEVLMSEVGQRSLDNSIQKAVFENVCKATPNEIKELKKEQIFSVEVYLNDGTPYMTFELSNECEE